MIITHEPLFHNLNIQYVHPKPSGAVITTNHCLHTKHVLHARTGTLQVVYLKTEVVKTIIT